MLAAPAIGPLLAVTSIMGSLTNKHLLFLGPHGYDNAIDYELPNKVPGETLVHELTHVWQGEHADFQWSYVGNSVGHQCLQVIGGPHPYVYTTGSQWKDYGAEQQAKIVADFFKETQGAFVGVPDNRNFPYIESNIRAGSAYGPTVFPKPPPLSITEIFQLIATLRIRRQVLVQQGYNPVFAIQSQLEIATIDAQISALMVLATTPGAAGAASAGGGVALSGIAGPAQATSPQDINSVTRGGVSGSGNFKPFGR